MTALERPAGRPACGARPAGARHRRTGRAEYERLRAAGVSHDAAESGTFSIQHPLRERLDGELFDCQLHAWLSEQDGPPAKPGRYRVHEPYGDSLWERLS